MKIIKNQHREVKDDAYWYYKVHVKMNARVFGLPMSVYCTGGIQGQHIIQNDYYIT